MKSNSPRWKGIFVVSAVVLVLAIGGAVADRDASITKSFDVRKGGELIVSIENAGADILIHVWNKNEVNVKADGIPEDDQEDLEITQQGNTVSVEYYGRGWRRSRHARFVVNVPSEFNLDLATAGGDIEVDDKIKGRVEAATSGGDVEVQDVEGSVALGTSGGDISARNIKGDGEMKTSGGDIEIENVDGELDVKTSGGDITVGNVAKNLDAKTAGGDIIVGDVGGDVDLATAGGDLEVGKVTGTAKLRTAGGDIEIRSASGSVVAQTAGGDLVLLNISGSITAETAGGDIEAEMIDLGTRDSEFETKGGDIHLAIAPNLKVTIDAEIRIHGGWDEWEDDYDIYSDFEAETKERDRRGIHARYVINGGGKQIRVETMHGDIEIRKLSR